VEETDRSDLKSLISLLVGVVALVALLTWWGGWALPVVIGSIFVMVMGHEFGHFIMAKRSGMEVSDFFVGFGPVIWSATYGETRYGVRALLLGGYVKVPGMTWDATVPEEQESRTYRSASYPRKVIFASAGSFMHLVMAFLLAWASLTLIGLPSSSNVGIQAFSHWDGYQKNAAQAAGLKIGDRVISVDGKLVTNVNVLIDTVRDHAGKPVTLVVDRAGRDLTLKATPANEQTLKENGKPIYTGADSRGLLGVDLEELTVRTPWYSAIPGSFSRIGSMMAIAVHAMVHVFSPGEFASLFHQVTSVKAATNPINQDTRPVSIVGVVRVAVQGAQSGTAVLLEILMTVNIFVGMLNMLPLLPLDGGYVAIATYERLRSRRGKRYHANLNLMTPVIYAFMTVLLVLFASTMYLDIAHPIANPFQ
jgi:membrane-associated protease RseP (regulator of RpoE activity)